MQEVHTIVGYHETKSNPISENKGKINPLCKVNWINQTQK